MGICGLQIYSVISFSIYNLPFFQAKNPSTIIDGKNKQTCNIGYNLQSTFTCLLPPQGMEGGGRGGEIGGFPTSIFSYKFSLLLK